jgi:hypothetical protein
MSIHPYRDNDYRGWSLSGLFTEAEWDAYCNQVVAIIPIIRDYPIFVWNYDRHWKLHWSKKVG